MSKNVLQLKNFRPSRTRSIKRQSATHILIACMPKSGSTFLSDVISELPQFIRAELVPAAGRREQELDEFCLQQVDGLSYVAQVHVRDSEWTAEMSRDYGLKTVVLVRSLLDIVVSLRDHLRRETHIWPNFHAEAHHAQMDDAALELMIARLAMPWFVNFYMGWRQRGDALMIAYESLIHDPNRTVREILAFAGEAVDSSEVRTAVARVCERGQSRLNVGVAGRGASLRPKTIHTILDLLEAYPEADNDPYITAVRAQAAQVLAGTPAPAPRPPSLAVAPDPVGSSWRWLSGNARRLMARRVAPALLVALALLYWFWPGDLIPDASASGYVDDAVVGVVLSVMAGRMTRYKFKKPGGRLRRGRPLTA
ncbi:MAG: sulfotransferase domain-containing protein [Caulobacteraceae bacterium]|nr:sulfotransferase domain-containing protein [Caulobacteraceae bacterium]